MGDHAGAIPGLRLAEPRFCEVRALIKRDGSTGSFGNVTAARGGAYYIAIEALRLERVVVFH